MLYHILNHSYPITSKLNILNFISYPRSVTSNITLNNTFKNHKSKVLVNIIKKYEYI